MEIQMARAADLRAGVLAITILVLTLLSPSLTRAASVDALLISSIATGGSSASDEYVVIEAAGVGGANIADYELVYTTASGATTRRLISLEGLAPLAAGARLLVANSLGSFSGGAFATWSEGIAATGGAVRLRMRSTPTLVADAVSWGSATSSAGGFGTQTLAMSSTTMIERRHSADLTLINTQSSSADFALVPLGPPNLTPVVPVPPSPTLEPTPTPTVIPSPTIAPTPTATITPAPTATTTSAPTPHVLTPSEVRAAPLGGTVTMRGTVSAAPGELAEERLYCVEDAETGVGVFVLAQSGDVDLARGDVVTIAGTVILRRQALTLAATSPAQVDGWAEAGTTLTVEPPTPGPWAWEAWEGRVIQVAGTVSGAIKDLTGGSRSLTLRLPGGGELLVGVAPGLSTRFPKGSLPPSGPSRFVGWCISEQGPLGAATASGRFR
jgi:predicted extracellular nuclease